VKYLVDANVLSEPTKPAPNPRVIEWLRVHEQDLAVDPIILGEMRFGILLRRKGKKPPCHGKRARACDGLNCSRVFARSARPCRLTIWL